MSLLRLLRIFFKEKVASKNVVSLIKHEAAHANRLSINIHADAGAMQLAMETTTKLSQLKLISTNKMSIIGFIHELGQKPFGYVLVSNLQVIFLNQI